MPWPSILLLTLSLSKRIEDYRGTDKGKDCNQRFLGTYWLIWGGVWYLNRICFKVGELSVPHGNCPEILIKIDL